MKKTTAEKIAEKLIGEYCPHSTPTRFHYGAAAEYAQRIADFFRGKQEGAEAWSKAAAILREKSV